MLDDFEIVCLCGQTETAQVFNQEVIVFVHNRKNNFLAASEVSDMVRMKDSVIECVDIIFL